MKYLRLIMSAIQSSKPLLIRGCTSFIYCFELVFCVTLWPWKNRTDDNSDQDK